MQNQLKVAAIQSNLVWENQIQNLNNFEEKVDGIEDSVDLNNITRNVYYRIYHECC